MNALRGAKFNSGTRGCRDKIEAMRRCLLTLLTLLALGSEAHAVQLPGLEDFIGEMVQRHQFDRSYLEAVFAQARHRQSIIDAMSSPSTRKPWPEYRANVVEPRRIKRGIAFWQQNQDTLARAEQQYGVPAEIVVALIGIETVYGRNTGKFLTLDALTTLAFDYPRRADFFRGELEQFLLLVREQKLDLLEVKGSYAGALGMPQFMPGSYRRYAVDFDRDGQANLLTDTDDVIGSVANYLHEYGWQKDGLVAVRSDACDAEDVPCGYADRSGCTGGVATDHAMSDARLLELTVADGKERWLTFNNFDVITKYNNSSFYAMSVFQLASELRASFTARQ